MEADVITLQDLYVFHVDAVATDRSRTIVGSLNGTGLRPTFLEKFERRGIELPVALQRAAPAAQLVARRGAR
jgi:hypothetical protein